MPEQMVTAAPMNAPICPDPLRHAARMARMEDAAPVIVVGLPRSGSTFLAHVLSGMDDLFVFDDLYCLQKAEALGCNGPLTPAQLHDLLHFLGWQTRARISYKPTFEQLPLTWDDVDVLCDTLGRVLGHGEVTWPEVMTEFLTRLARVCGKNRWGYKTPQDFHHMDRLFEIFPRVRFLFIMRDPVKVLASFKFNRSQDGSVGQYHPWIYARYWRMAAEVAHASARRLRVPLLTVRFEDLVASPEQEARRIGTFLGTRPTGVISTAAPNSSFGDGSRRSITPTEAWICRRTIGPTLAQFGYACETGRFRLRDIPDLLWTTIRFCCYQTWRICTHPVARVKVASFCRRLFNGRSAGPEPA